MSLNRTIPIKSVAGAKGKETLYISEFCELFYLKTVYPNGNKLFRCCSCNKCNKTATLDGVTGELRTNKQAHGAPTCHVSENEYIIRQATQQIKFNAEVAGVEDSFNTMMASLSNPQFVPQSFINSRAIESMQSKESFSSTLGRHSSVNQPNLPHDVQELEWQLKQDEYADMSNFSPYGDEDDKEQFVFTNDRELGEPFFIIFSCAIFLSILIDELTVYMDGTFKVVPKIFNDFHP
jgi:hypothetical protein